MQIDKVIEASKRINHILSKFPLQMQNEKEPNKIYI